MFHPPPPPPPPEPRSEPTDGTDPDVTDDYDEGDAEDHDGQRNPTDEDLRFVVESLEENRRSADVRKQLIVMGFTAGLADSMVQAAKIHLERGGTSEFVETVNPRETRRVVAVGASCYWAG